MNIAAMGRPGPKPEPFECPEEHFWYLVGLIATDGCLSSNGRHVNITSKDKRYLVRVREAVGLRCKVSDKTNGRGQGAFHMQIGSRVLYDKLLAIGLTPRKSLTLGQLNVPDSRFKDFLRGVIDGDGNIRGWRHPSNGRQQWALRVYGASKPFLQWIKETISRLWRVEAGFHKSHTDLDRRMNRQPQYALKYGKLAAKIILSRCYYSGAIALERKRKIAAECVATQVGWSKSKTVLNPEDWRGWSYVHAWPDRTVTKVLERDTSSVFTDEFLVECDAPG